jgi:uncharacterized membrane protein YgdD (TMEM256/DUF423 family)
VPGVELLAGVTTVGGVFLLIGWWQGSRKTKKQA